MTSFKEYANDIKKFKKYVARIQESKFSAWNIF